MQAFEYFVPTEIVFGAGSTEKLPELLKKRGLSRVLVVYGGASAKKSGLLDRVFRLLDEAGVQYRALGGVQPNPRAALAREGVQLALESGAELILAVGGGSVIDTCKAIAHGAANPGTDIWEFWKRRAPLTKSMPVGVVLTIPAAGSEASKNTVISNDELGMKTGYASNYQRPKLAFMNPELTFTLPPFQTAAGITDMFCHLLERFFDDVGAVPVTDGMNLSVMRTLLAPSMLNVIVDNLKKGNAEGRLFEMAPVYLAKELPIQEHPHERQTLCLGAFGPAEDFFTVKGALEALAAGFDLTFTYQRETTSWLHPGISAAVYCNGKRLGVFGKLANEINAELEIAKEQKDSQNIYLGELDYEALMSCVEGELRYKPLSPYAAVKRDLALVCDEAVACGDIEEAIKKEIGRAHV